MTGNMTFSDVVSMVVSWWIVAFLRYVCVMNITMVLLE